ncbi:unnamed protein product [Spirodela intermedia]|uniref:Uncharacterized protein n=1 Tax=Spirodela intermedia TaxID=51605 RepID=A0A7I8JNY2_SPIIN|nr:unnamed protein product [Spirodela intermedia]CAA6671907.1 unnamed protein product [Spirodela intermedia]
MSKKKAFSGSTMTLKDFHGGSIPSDLPLPSAPGSRDRWRRRAGAAGPPPARPGSAGGGGGGAVRGLEEGAPFLSHIGRNFDEDERKPFDATSAPRRAVPSGDDAVRSTRSVEARAQIHQQTLAPGRPASSPATQASPQAHHSFGGYVVWPGAASRFAQASAIEKVTSGRWQSKPGMLNQIPDAEAVPLSETGGGDARFRENDVAAAEGGSQRRYGDRANFDRVYDRVRSPVYSERRRRAYQAPIVNLVPAENVTEALGDSNPSKPSSGVGDGGNLPVERPKLNLLPRSQQVQQSSEYVEKKREKVFGGARPREVVLKERGVDDAALSLGEGGGEGGASIADGEAAAGGGGGEGESQWSSRWSDGRRSLREGEKAAESRAETESWRRREEPPPPKPAEQAALRFGKAASAVELAQAFSRSVSDAKPAAAAAAAARAQAAPFSRLTEAAAAAPPEIYSGGARRHINGY